MRDFFVREQWRSGSGHFMQAETPEQAAKAYAVWRAPLVHPGEARDEVYEVFDRASDTVPYQTIRLRFEYRLSIELVR